MTRKCKENAVQCYIYIVLTIATICLFVVAYWLFYPYKLIEFNEVPYPVNDKEVYQGGIVEYAVDYCKYTDMMPESVERKFIDGIIFESADVRANIVMGCAVADVKTPIPTTIPAGKYHMEIVVVYKPNPIRTVTFTNVTEEFTVLDVVNPERNKIIDQ